MKDSIAQLIFDLQIAASVFETVEIPASDDSYREAMFNANHAKLLRDAAKALEDIRNTEQLAAINEYRVKHDLEPLESL
jgi:hypothetical protein